MLRLLVLPVVLVLASTALVRADGAAVAESWETATLEGSRVGHFHLRTTRVGVDRLKTTTVLALKFRRYNSTVEVRREATTEESPEGKVFSLVVRQARPGGADLTFTGMRDGDTMNVHIAPADLRRRVRWSDEALGLLAQERLPALKKVKVGDRFRFQRYEPTYNALVTVQATVGPREMVAVGGERRALLRLDLVPDALVAPGVRVQPAKAVWWLDDDLSVARRQMDLEGLGNLVLTRSTKGIALAPVAAVAAPDVGLASLVPLARTLARPHQARAILYRVIVRGEEEVGTTFASDTHQNVRNVRGDSFDLYVRPVRMIDAPAVGARVEAPGREHLSSNRYLDHADAGVREAARLAVGMETDLWRKALRIERWVREALKPDNVADMVPASGVARSLRGDCRAAALLVAALLRAEGIPSRTAQGLVYVERGRRPALGFHMWAEAWVNGRWLGLDGTLGLGRVGPAHMKINDHTWHDTDSLVPLLPVGRVLGRLGVEVLRVE